MAKLTQKQEIEMVAQAITDVNYLDALYSDLLDLVRLNDNMKNVYFYKPQPFRGAKNYYDKQNSMAKEFEFGSYVFRVNLVTETRGKHIYFDSAVTTNAPWSKTMGTINKMFEAVRDRKMQLTQTKIIQTKMINFSRSNL